MRKRVVGCLAALLCGVAAAGSAMTATTELWEPDSVRVLVVYYTMSGNTQILAEAVAEGARSVAGTEVSLKTVAEVERADLEACDALIIGSPTYWGTMATPVKQFIDDWLFDYQVFLGDKVGGAFATGGGDGGGKGLVVLSILTAMLNNGMVIAGPHYTDGQARFGGFGVGATTGPESPGLDEAELARARLLGERVANVAKRYR
jgi:NAD(P)H dehydrogenase (quinone)